MIIGPFAYDTIKPSDQVTPGVTPFDGVLVRSCSDLHTKSYFAGRPVVLLFYRQRGHMAAASLHVRFGPEQRTQLGRRAMSVLCHTATSRMSKSQRRERPYFGGRASLLGDEHHVLIVDQELLKKNCYCKSTLGCRRNSINGFPPHDLRFACRQAEGVTPLQRRKASMNGGCAA
jgi:hypothetical protein